MPKLSLDVQTELSLLNGVCLTCKHPASFLSGCPLTPHWWPLTLLTTDTVCCFDLVFTGHWCCLFLVFIYFDCDVIDFKLLGCCRERFMDAGGLHFTTRRGLLVKFKNITTLIPRSTINFNTPILWHIRWYRSYMQFRIFNGNHIFSFLTALISLINSKHALNTFSLNRVKIFCPSVSFYSSTCMHKHSYTADVDATSDEKNQSTNQIIIYHLNRVSICRAININCLNLLSM